IYLVDFGTGDNQYKEVFANDCYGERKLLLCRKTPKMIALGAALGVTHDVDHRLRHWMKEKELTETMRALARGNISWRAALSTVGERMWAKKTEVPKKD
ncbi:MAG: hypothetical protein KBF88_15630, partial [Polyangiaceae bacterium]|nr:hypothetical protein [Polyangiaceae bacterium]